MRTRLPAMIALFVLQAADAAWVKIPKPAGMPQFANIAVGPGGNLYSFRGGTVWHSADRGASFQRSPRSVKFGSDPIDSNSLSVYSTVAAPSGSLFQSLLSRTGGSERKAVVRSRDHGKTWTSVGDTEGVIGARLFASPKGEIFAADMFAYEYDHDTVWISRDDGDTWKPSGIFERIMSMAVDPDGAVFVIGYRVGEVQRSGRYNLFKTTDGGARWDSLGSPEGRGGEPALAANRKGCLAVAYTRGIWIATPAAPSLTLSADTAAFTETRTSIVFTPEHHLLIAVDRMLGVLDFAPPYASHASLNAGLGMDSIATFRDMHYDDQDNLYTILQPVASNEVNLYVLKASGAGIQPSTLRVPGRTISHSHDFNGRRLPARVQARTLRAGGLPPIPPID